MKERIFTARIMFIIRIETLKIMMKKLRMVIKQLKMMTDKLRGMMLN